MPPYDEARRRAAAALARLIQPPPPAARDLCLIDNARDVVDLLTAHISNVIRTQITLGLPPTGA